MDPTSTRISKGKAERNNTNVLVFFALFVAGVLYYSRSKRVKSGVGLINISISPHNELIAIIMGTISLLMYGYHLYLENKECNKSDN